jgi:hypothetical protein
MVLSEEGRASVGESVAVLGFSQADAMLHSVSQANLVKVADRDCIYYTAGTEAGMTGAPALRLVGDDSYVLVGVHDSYSNKGEAYPSMATTVKAIREWLKRERTTQTQACQCQIDRLLSCQQTEDDVNADCEEDSDEIQIPKLETPSRKGSGSTE